MLHEKYNQKTKSVLMCLRASIVAGLLSAIYIGYVSTEVTAKGDSTKLNIVLVHGIWFDAYHDRHYRRS
jgi:hypothetical protein